MLFMDLYEEMKKVIVALETAGVPYALCGGLAMALHRFPRATMDIGLMADRIRTISSVWRKPDERRGYVAVRHQSAIAADIAVTGLVPQTRQGEKARRISGDCSGYRVSPEGNQ